MQSFLDDELKKLESSGSKCPLKKTTIETVNQLRWTKTVRYFSFFDTGR